MIINRKTGSVWRNLEGYPSRLSGPYYYNHYVYNASCHRLYGRFLLKYWDLNDKRFTKFKEVL